MSGRSLRADELVERGTQLESLDNHVERLLGGRGGLVAIVGEAGIGKSSLLEAVAERARERGVDVLLARAHILEGAFPFGVARRLLGEPLGGVEVAASVARLLAPTSYEPEPITVEAPREAALLPLLEAFFAGLLALAAIAPRLLILDDAHWSDRESLRFLAYAAARVRESPILILLGVRSGEPSPAVRLLETILEQTPTVRPGALGAAGVGEVLERAAEAPPGPLFVAAALRETGGNPFLVQELAEALAGVPPSDENVDRLVSMVPAGVLASVLVRLRRLPPAATELARALAVLGGSGGIQRAASLADLAPETGAAAASALATAGILSATAPLQFRHGLVCSTIYEEIDPLSRTAMHKAAARALAAEPLPSLDAIAAHLLATDPAADRWAAGLLERAGKRALAQGAPDTAVSYLRRAVAERPGDEVPVEILVTIADAEQRRDGSEAAEELLVQALAGSADPSQRAEIAYRLATVLGRAGRVTEAAELLVAAAGALSEDDFGIGLRLESKLLLLADLDPEAGRYLSSRQPRFRLRASAAVQDTNLRAGLAAEIEEEMNRGSARRATELTLRVLDRGRLIAEEQTGSLSVLQFANTLVLCDALVEAERAFEQAVAAAERGGSAAAVDVLRGLRAGVRWRQGALVATREDAEAALAAVPPLSVPGMFALGYLAEALVAAGELHAAEACLIDHGATGKLPDSLPSIGLRHARGRVRQGRGDADAALADFLDCGEVMGRWRMRTPASACWQASAAEVMVESGDLVGARRIVGEGVAAAERFESPRALGIMVAAAARIDADEAGLERAVALLAEAGAKLEEARARVSLGVVLEQRGAPLEARPWLRSGLRLARLCGGESLAAIAHTALTRTGVTPRKILRGGRASLTPAERRTAELAADGLTNKQLAARLVLSVRTIETHLSRAYQKLDIDSRGELGEALGISR